MRLKKKGLIPVISLICVAALMLIAAGCGNGGTDAGKVDFPTKDVRFICPQSPGGGFDTYSRALAKTMPKYLPNKVNIVVENITGAGWRVGLNQLMNAKPDGYTIGIYNIPGNIIDQIVGGLEKDVTQATWFGQIIEDGYMGALSPKSKFKTLEDLQKADEVKVGVTGMSSSGSLGLLVTAEMMGIKIKPVIHDGAMEAVLSCIRGDVDYVQLPIDTMLPYTARSNELIPIIVFNKERLTELPDVQTTTEYGYPELLPLVTLYAVAGAPEGMPEEIADIWRDAFEQAVKDPEFNEILGQAKRGPASYASAGDTQELVNAAFKTFSEYESMIKQYVK